MGCPLGASIFNVVSGRIRNASTIPISIKTMLPRKGSCQFPVRSITYPETTGLIIAARAEPVFIMPLAVPDISCAMSMGTAHIGPIVISAKKNPADKHASDT